MNNLSNLSAALFGAGFASVLLMLIILCFRVAKSKKAFNGGAKFLMFLTVAALGAGGASMAFHDKLPADVLSLKAINKALPNVAKTENVSSSVAPNSSAATAAKGASGEEHHASSPKAPKAATQHQAGGKAFTQAPFDPNGSVHPKVIKNDTVGGIQAIIDADGTETLVCSRFAFPLFINPDNSAYGFDDILGGTEAEPGAGQMYVFVPNGKEVAGKGHGCTEYSFNTEGGIAIDQYDNQ